MKKARVLWVLCDTSYNKVISMSSLVQKLMIGTGKAWIKDVRDRSAIMVCQVKFGAKILPVYSPLNIKVK